MRVQDRSVWASGPLDQRERRHRREHVELRERVTAVANVTRQSTVVGTSHRLVALLPSFGFRPFDLLALRIIHEGRGLELIVAPSRIWFEARDRARLFQLKRAAASAGLRCLVLPASLFKRRPRLDNALMISRTMRIGMTVSQRMKVELHVMENGRADLQECAELLTDHTDPFGAVLSLVASGRLELKDLGHPLTPQSELVLRHHR